MRTRPTIERRVSNRPTEIALATPMEGLGIFLTVVLLLLILTTGSLILGAARLWTELPLLGLAAVLLFVQGLRLRARVPTGSARQADAIDLTVVLFTVYTIIRWLTSPSEYFSRIEAMDVTAYATVFLTCRHGFVARKLGLLIVVALGALGLFETGFGFYLSKHEDFFPFGPAEQLQLYYAPRWVGTYGCPNHYGALLVMAAGATLALASFSKLAWPVRIVLFYLAGVIMVGVMESASRGSWLGMIAAVIALMIVGLRFGAVRWWVPVTGTALLLLSAAALFSLSPNVRDRFGEAQNTVQNGSLAAYCRIELTHDALHIARDHPLFGTGPGTFIFVHPRYQSNDFPAKAMLTHDDYLNCLDDYGIIGFALAMFFIDLVTLKFFQALRMDARWQDRVVVATGCAAWAALLVHSAVDFNLHIPANALWLFALIGVALGRFSRSDAAGHWSTLPLDRLGNGLSWLVIALSLFLGFFAVRTALGDVAYEEASADALSIPISDSIDATQQALGYDPGNTQALILLGDLHRYQASRRPDIESRMSEGQLALAAYRDALRTNRLDDTIQARMGMTFDLMLRYPEAYFCYSSAVKAQPTNGQFWYWLANHYWQRGMLDEAATAYERSQACPHGSEGAAEALAELRTLPDAEQIPLAPPDAPAAILAVPESPEDHPPTVP